MESRNVGTLGLSVLHTFENYDDSWDKPTMDRKNINRGLKKLRVWQDDVSLYVLACKKFTA